jgi:hypothetical protein
MKKSLIAVCLMACSSALLANEPHLVVQRVDNHGMVPGSTFRLYCALDQGQTLQVVYGDQSNPLSIRTEGDLYNHEFGGNTSSAINAFLAEEVPTLNYDSWMTLGFENSTNNDLWELGVDYSGFAANNQMVVDNGGWFLVPTSSKCSPNENGLILLAQFTTTGKVSGELNIQGRNGSNPSWNVKGLTFSTENAVVFGCNDKAATNYQPEAEYYDASACQYKSGSSKPEVEVGYTPSSDWSVFPNPLRDNLINVQWSGNIEFAETKPTLQIIDASGKVVYKMDVQPGDISNNRMMIDLPLAAGSYQIVWTNGNASSNKTLIVQK